MKSFVFWRNPPLPKMSVGSCVCYRYRNRHKGKAIPVEGYYRPRGFQEIEAPKFQDIRYVKMVRQIFPVLISVKG